MPEAEVWRSLAKINADSVCLTIALCSTELQTPLVDFQSYFTTAGTDKINGLRRKGGRKTIS